MRNLKKILALVLALVMSFSLMATANAFTDSEKITDTYETAVTVLDGLKVFQGYEDGSFRPQDAIKRSEVAAIIYRIVTGDVAGTQVGIYADYNKFTDVKSTSWYAGYVNFCANAEYIKGRDAKTFDPDAYVTGYEALAMILRAIGYDKNGEFTGSNWQVQTAATGEQRGITKNISEGTLGTYATREVVAEILFQTILVDKVNYTPAFGYQLDDTSLGWDTFELEEITGVVIANEYADLYSTSPLKAGKTELDVDGDSYTLAYSTTLEDIGEARDAYITEGENVLYIADAGNTVFETGAASDIEKDKDFEKATGLERDEDTTEQFINFSQDGKWTCDYMLTYGYKGNVDENGNATHSERNVKAGNAITISELKAVFDDNNGYVYLGTKNTDNSEDYSSTMSWNKFRSDYLSNSYTEDIGETDNGEWLKVIDNNGDGVADVVLLTEFAMSVIERISKDGEYTLANLADADVVNFDNNTVELDGDDIVTEDELAEDDVVIYTLIDGKYYMNIAEVVTETIDKKGINSKTETITCDGTDYVQSHIGYTDETSYLWDVTDAHTEETYDLYLDHFGYVRLLVESDYNTFMLLTDGWYEDDNRTETFKAEYWNVEASEKQDIDVVDNDAEFIHEGGAGDQETWGMLRSANEIAEYDAYGSFASNIAGYSETSDGYDLKQVQDSTSRTEYMVQSFDVDKLKDRELDADIGNDIQTTTNTQYYLVIREGSSKTHNGWKITDVITWTGYNNAPAEAKLADGSVGYAVTHETKTSSKTYNVADVVVFETEAYADRDTYFVYARNNYSDNIEYVWGIGYNEEGVIETQRKDVEGTDVAQGMIEFYEIFENETASYIGIGDYADHNIYAGWVETSWDIEGENYIQVLNASNKKMYIDIDAPIYTISDDSRGVDKYGFTADPMDRDKVNVGDAVILFTDDDNNVEYAIYVGSLAVPHTTDVSYDLLVDLWDRIMNDVADYDELLADALQAAEDAINMKDDTADERAEKLEALEKALKSLTILWTDKDAIAAFDKDQIAELDDAIKAVEAEIEAIGDAADLEGIVANLIAVSEDATATTDEKAAAYLAYLAVEDQLTAEQKASAALALARIEAAINAMVRPATTATTWTGIKAEYGKATDLTANEIAAYDAINGTEADPTPLADDVAAVKAQYDAAAANMALINALVKAHADYTLLTNDSTKAALLDAFDAVNEAKANDAAYALLGAGTAEYTAYADAYSACQWLVKGDTDAALKAKGEALVAAKAAYDADKTDANEDALLAALNNISDEENTAIAGLGVSGYDYNACLKVFTDKAAADRNAVVAALDAAIAAHVTVTANSRESAIAAVKAWAENAIAGMTLANDSDITVKAVEYAATDWTNGTSGNTQASAANFTITVGASYKGVDVATKSTTPYQFYITTP